MREMVTASLKRGAQPVRKGKGLERTRRLPVPESVHAMSFRKTLTPTIGVAAVESRCRYVPTASRMETGLGVAARITEGVRARGSVVIPQASSSNSAPMPAIGDVWEKAKMPTYFFLWYAFNIVFNIYNKSALNVFPYPWFLSTIQLGTGVLFMALLWIAKLHPVPKVDRGLLLPLAAVSLFHTIGHVSSCISFSKMAISFTHVIKSAEPVFSVVISSLFFGESYNPWVWASLAPIVLGCSAAAMKEVSFNVAGFQGAMISNLAFVLRNIISKKSLTEYKDTIDGVNLYGLISIFSLVYIVPMAIIQESALWDAGFAAAAAKIGQAQLLWLIAIGGITYHLYNQTSYMALTGISAVTFSVGNTMKRVVVILSSVAFFRNPISPLNWAGTTLAILGTYLYSQAQLLKK